MEQHPDVLGQVTDLDDVVLPQILVKLNHWKTKDGKPVTVLVEMIPPLELASLCGALPGERPPLVDPGPKLKPGERPSLVTIRKKLEELKKVEMVVDPLIERSAQIRRGGRLVPAFWFKAPVDGRLDGNKLHPEDKLDLANAILEVSGASGGPAAEAAGSFPEESEAGPDGQGNLGPVPGDEGTASPDDGPADPEGAADGAGPGEAAAEPGVVSG